MVRLFVLTLCVFNLVILAGVALQSVAGSGEPIVLPLPDRKGTEIARIVLASELPEPARPRPEPVKPGPEPAEPVVEQCLTLGPFESLAEAELLRPSLEPLTIFLAPREMAIQHEVGHWVYVPPLESRAAAIAVTDRLQQAEYDDFFIVPRGHLAGAISLGIFSQEQGALKSKARIDALDLGIEVAIATETRSVQAFSLDLQLADAGAEIPWSEILDGHDGLSWQETACTP